MVKVKSMRRWWLKLIFCIVIIVLLVFVVLRAYRILLNVLGMISNGGGTPIPDEQFAEEIWTQPPYVIDDSAYDEVTAVREYEEETPVPTEEN